MFEAGDIVFIRIDNMLYRRVAEATGSWISHVGVIVETGSAGETVAESTVPVSRFTPLSEFIARSENSMFSVKRLKSGLSADQKLKLKTEAAKRMGILYHTGFKLDSSRQFCSKFVYDVLLEATGVKVGKIESFAEILRKKPLQPKWFWHLWYFGFIPWSRRTITPASQYESDELVTVEENLSG